MWPCNEWVACQAAQAGLCGLELKHALVASHSPEDCLGVRFILCQIFQHLFFLIFHFFFTAFFFQPSFEVGLVFLSLFFFVSNFLEQLFLLHRFSLPFFTATIFLSSTGHASTVTPMYCTRFVLPTYVPQEICPANHRTPCVSTTLCVDRQITPCFGLASLAAGASPRTTLK